MPRKVKADWLCTAFAAIGGEHLTGGVMIDGGGKMTAAEAEEKTQMARGTEGREPAEPNRNHEE